MRKISYRPVYNRKHMLNAQGTALLQVEAYLERRKIYFSTHIYLSPEQWDNRKRIIMNHPNAEALNAMLHSFIIDLERREIELWRNGQEITLGKMKDTFRFKHEQTFAGFIKSEIETSHLKDSTKKNRFSTLHLLKEFNNCIEFGDITSQFIYGFEAYLYKNGFQTNTVGKHMKHLKAFVNAAINKGYMDANDYPFKRYRIKMKEGKHVFLLPEELNKLEGLALRTLSPVLEHTLDAFLFCCYTGLRYSDFINMKDENITMIEGCPWLVFHTVKTGTEVKLPIHLLFEGKGWTIIRKYRDKLEDFFHLKPNSNANKDLQRIARMAGISKHFSFHSARHTNATLLIYKGANITTVQKLLGHRNLATTQIYSEVLGSTIVRDLKKCAKC